MINKYGDVSVAVEHHVAWVEMHRPPHNFFDYELVKSLADAFAALDRDESCRALVLTSEGKSFCAGADFKPHGGASESVGANQIYREAVRLFSCEKPVVAAVQGAAVGGGLGLALVADFRVVSPEARFVANFVRLGIHPGFGLTYTLPRLIGVQRATLMFLTARRIHAEEAVSWGLADALVAPDRLQETAREFAAEIAEGAPLAVRSTRRTLRRGLPEMVKLQTDHEFSEQSRLMQTEDHREGVQAVAERRQGRFVGR